MNTIITSTTRFEDLELTVIHKDGQHWFTAKEVGRALGFANPKRSVNLIFTRHQNEFRQGKEFDVIDIRSLFERGDQIDPPSEKLNAGGSNLRIFSYLGVLLIGFYAQTPRGEALRLWARERLVSERNEIAALRQENDELHRRLAALQRELLAARPFWRSIAAMKEMRSPEGERLSNQTIARALGVHRDTLRKHLRRMEALGLIQPDPAYAKFRRMAAHLPLFRNLDNLH